MMSEEGFDRYVQDSLQLVNRSAEELRHKHGIGEFERWDLDQKSCVLTFSDPVRPKLIADCYAVGTLANGTWKWAWANPSLVPELSKDSVKLREMTKRAGLDVFERELINVDADMPWEFCGIALREIGGLGAYRCGTEDKALFVVIRSVAGEA